MISHRFALIAGTVLLALSGCAATSDGPSGADSTATGSRATVPASEPKAGSDSCGDTAGKVRDQLSRPEVQAVEVEGQCTTVSITTTLADSDSATAKQLCDAAAGVAYSGDINSIRVLGKSTKELAVGLPNVPCIAEP